MAAPAYAIARLCRTDWNITEGEWVGVHQRAIARLRERKAQGEEEQRSIFSALFFFICSIHFIASLAPSLPSKNRARAPGPTWEPVTGS